MLDGLISLRLQIFSLFKSGGKDMRFLGIGIDNKLKNHMNGKVCKFPEVRILCQKADWSKVFHIQG